ncbi:MAG: hypothetical protein IPI30_04390 [Saprospiraceae bacterium]|nr:hypothetical protein [Candidatus Vicinibacter affinis]
MDHAPGGDAKHDADWDKNVDVYVEEYGESHFGNYRINFPTRHQIIIQVILTFGLWTSNRNEI